MADSPYVVCRGASIIFMQLQTVVKGEIGPGVKPQLFFGNIEARISKFETNQKSECSNGLKCL
jgi:hypothetical protein